MYSVSHIVISDQEIESFGKILKLGNQAFQITNFPLSYDCFLANLHTLVKFCKHAIHEASPEISLQAYLKEEKILLPCLRKIGRLEYQPLAEKIKFEKTYAKLLQKQKKQTKTNR